VDEPVVRRLRRRAGGTDSVERVARVVDDVLQLADAVDEDLRVRRLTQRVRGEIEVVPDLLQPLLVLRLGHGLLALAAAAGEQEGHEQQAEDRGTGHRGRYATGA